MRRKWVRSTTMSFYLAEKAPNRAEPNYPTARLMLG
jgi:hypothetical protein